MFEEEIKAKEAQLENLIEAQMQEEADRERIRLNEELKELKKEERAREEGQLAEKERAEELKKVNEKQAYEDIKAKRREDELSCRENEAEREKTAL